MYSLIICDSFLNILPSALRNALEAYRQANDGVYAPFTSTACRSAFLDCSLKNGHGFCSAQRQIEVKLNARRSALSNFVCRFKTSLLPITSHDHFLHCLKSVAFCHHTHRRPATIHPQDTSFPVARTFASNSCCSCATPSSQCTFIRQGTGGFGWPANHDAFLL